MHHNKFQKQKAVIICGPTASGKTNFAHHVAKNNNGEIINADSMQIYKQLPIITASPSKTLKEELPYHMYNFCDVDQEFSAAKYVQKANQVIRTISDNNKLPIIIGGTGMYISMLVNGYSAIPDIDQSIRNEARNLHQSIGSEEFFKRLEAIDPKSALKLNSADSQRVIRAYEVVTQTGKSILDFQEEGNIKLLADFEFEIIFLLPERKFLYQTCNNRLQYLFDNGAIEEVEELHKKYGDLKTSAMKALGVSEIISYLKNDITMETAIDLASAKTRQYAKRQITWFRNQLKSTNIIKFSTAEEYRQIFTK